MRFWTKPRVRVYTLLVTMVVIASTAVRVLVRAGLIPDSHALRVALSAGLVLVLLTLFTRIRRAGYAATAGQGPCCRPWLRPPGPVWILEPANQGLPAPPARSWRVAAAGPMALGTSGPEPPFVLANDVGRAVRAGAGYPHAPRRRS